VARLDPVADTVLEQRELGNITNVASFDRDSLGRIFAISLGTGSVGANTGVGYILESPSFAVPVRVRPAARRALRAPLLAEMLANPERYDLRGLDGKKISGVPSGAFLVRDRMAGGPPRLMAEMK